MNTIPSPCDNCRYQIQMNWHHQPFGQSKEPRHMYLVGCLQAYEHNLKVYLKDCCLYAYHIGSQGCCITQADKQALLAKMKIKAPKYVADDSGLFPVYELTMKQEDTVSVPRERKLKISRDCIGFNKCNLPYEIITKAEYAKRKKQQEQDVIMMSVDTPSCDEMPIHYVYLIRERTATLTNLPIYKIGKTTQSNFDRFKGYGKGYEILMHLRCNDCHSIERSIIDYFKTNYRHATEFGSEYFEGSYQSMMRDIFRIAMTA